MDGSDVKKLRDELAQLMQEQIESLKKETFGPLNPDELLQQRERLRRIREVSADFIATLKRLDE